MDYNNLTTGLLDFGATKVNSNMGYDDFNVTSDSLSTSFWTNDKVTWGESIGNAVTAPTEKASEGAYNEFTMQNITNFFRDLTGAAAGIYTAKAAVDISRVKAQTGLDLAKAQGLYPKAAGMAYDSSSTTALIAIGTVGLVIWAVMK